MQTNDEDKKINPWNGEEIPTNQEDESGNIVEWAIKKYRKIKTIYIDIFCFIGGPFLIAYYLIDFTNWDEETRLLIALGVCLVCWGFLNRSWAKNEKSVQ